MPSLEGRRYLKPKLQMYQYYFKLINYFSINGNREIGPITVTLTGDDALRSQYVSNEPAVKILKRPTNEGNLNKDGKKAAPKKTLQQREQEYAQARLRILGESSSGKAEERQVI